MTKIYVLTERHYEYNDENYYITDPNAGVGVIGFKDLEKAREKLIQVNSEWLFENRNELFNYTNGYDHFSTGQVTINSFNDTIQDIFTQGDPKAIHLPINKDYNIIDLSNLNEFNIEYITKQIFKPGEHFAEQLQSIFPFIIQEINLEN